jgi:chorismate synthase
MIKKGDIMSGNTFGKIFKITTWGESHGPAIGVVIDGCPPGISLSNNDIQKELDKRKPGQSSITTQRSEDDKAEILSGTLNGKTTGTPISIIIKNKDADSSKYRAIKDLFRPGHADLTFQNKYGIRDYNGGGRSSGRETAARVAAGAIAKKLIASKKVKVIGYAKSIGKITAKNINLANIEKNKIRCPDLTASKEMEKEILKAISQNDSVGGIVEIIIKDCPPGLGDPVFDKLDADIAKALMSIGAVKGIEIGSGFKTTEMFGSENNDQISSKGFLSNNSGGILGGISTGQDIIIRIAVKPTPSIGKMQKTVNIKNKTSLIKIEGRHDPCIVPRLIPVAEAMVALVIADKMLIQRCIK